MEPEPGRLRLAATLAVGIAAISSGAVLVKEAQEAPSLTIAFHRMLWAGVALSPAYWASVRRRSEASKAAQRTASADPSRRLWLAFAGLALALHFAFWITSLRYTSVAVSVLLVNTSPILVAGVSYLLFGERLTARGALGMTLAFLGAAFLFRHDWQRAGDWRGAALALAGAAALAGYFVAGRRIQQKAAFWSYVYPTYLLAGGLLGAFALLAGSRLSGFSTRTWVFLVLLGLIPQGIGHTCYNWSLRHLPATVVSTLVLAEPVLAPTWAWLFLGEALGAAEGFGGAFVAAGILLISLGGVVQSRTAGKAA